ncbi:Acyl-protein thioesterase 2, partial [Linum perenne]
YWSFNGFWLAFLRILIPYEDGIFIFGFEHHFFSLSGGKTAKRAFDFGKTFVVRPKGKHQATVVWLHGLGDNGSSWSQLLETLPLQNIKWICPTAPTRPITMFGGFPSTAWFDVRELSEDAPDDVEGLDAAANHVANLLASEPADIKIAIGGFSMGAATSLYSGTCFTMGKYADGNPYPANLTAVVGLSGWLPCSKTLGKQLAGVDGAANRATSLPILLCHGKGILDYLFNLSLHHFLCQGSDCISISHSLGRFYFCWRKH